MKSTREMMVMSSASRLSCSLVLDGNSMTTLRMIRMEGPLPTEPVSILIPLWWATFPQWSHSLDSSIWSHLSKLMSSRPPLESRCTTSMTTPTEMTVFVSPSTLVLIKSMLSSNSSWDSRTVTRFLSIVYTTSKTGPVTTPSGLTSALSHPRQRSTCLKKIMAHSRLESSDHPMRMFSVPI